MNRHGLTRRAFLGLAAGAGLAACSPTRPAYSIGAGEDRGFFSEFAHLLSAATSRSGAPFTLAPRPTAGTLQNMGLLRAGETDLALALADAAVADAEGLHAVGRVYLNYVQLVVPADSPVQALPELRGATMSIGAPESGTAHVGYRVLEASGLAADEVNLVEVPLTGILDALGAGTIQAALFAGGVPNPPVDPEAAGRGPASGIRLLDLSHELAVLREGFGPVYEPVTIPRGIYGAAGEVASIGVASLLLARADLPDDVVGRVVDVMVQRSAELVPAGALGVQYLDPRSLIYTSGIPLHPGAAAAYRRHHG